VVDMYSTIKVAHIMMISYRIFKRDLDF